MQDEKHDDATDNEASDGAPKNSDGKIAPAKKDHIIDIFEIAGGLVFGMIAVACSDAGFHKAGFLLGFLAVVCGLAVVAHHLQKLGQPHVKIGFWVCSVFMASLFIYLAAHPNPDDKSRESTQAGTNEIGSHFPEPKPRLSFGVIAKTNIWLTNDFIVVKGEYHSTDFPGLLLLPVNPTQRDAQVSFELVNEQDDTVIRSAEIVFITSRDFLISPERADDINWHISKEITDSGNLDAWQSLALLIPEIPSGTVFELPALHFQNIESQMNKPIFTRVLLNGIGIHRQEFAFWLAFRIETNIIYPHFIVMKSFIPVGSNIFAGSFSIDEDSPTNQ